MYKKISVPGTPSSKLIRVKEGETVLSPKEQKMYQYIVRILLYLVKHTRLDLTNATQELSKSMDVANYLHWKELVHVITFALQTQ